MNGCPTATVWSPTGRSTGGVWFGLADGGGDGPFMLTVTTNSVVAVRAASATPGPAWAVAVTVMM